VVHSRTVPSPVPPLASVRPSGLNATADTEVSDGAVRVAAGALRGGLGVAEWSSPRREPITTAPSIKTTTKKPINGAQRHGDRAAGG
jgi:hypothetical protein